MSRLSHIDTARSGRLSHTIHSARPTSHESQTSSSLRQKTASRAGSHHHHHHRAQPTSFQNQSPLHALSGESSDDEVSTNVFPLHRLKLALPRSPMPSPSRPGSSSSGRPPRSKKRKQERNRGERKASVRKEKYEIHSSSDLTEEPTGSEYEQNGPLRADDAAATSDSDQDMAAKLQAAGDGESLLGSAASDEENSVDEEEASYLIQETLQKEAKARARSRREMFHHTGLGGHGRGGGPDWGLHGAGEQKGRAAALHKGATLGVDMKGQDVRDANNRRKRIPRTSGRSADEAMELDTDEEDNVNVETLSPDTLRTLGLPVLDDELFEEQEGFNSSSEPSFTDFFASEDDEDEDVFDLSPRSDDDVLTDADEVDEGDDDDISDLDEEMLAAPFLAQVAEAQAALAAGEDGMNGISGEPTQAEIPMLVIEDLDGRLIYARAGDGEAVFGSDGEFEYLDDSEDEWSSDDDSATALEIRDDDSGDTTDELPDENMPFPRLLVGSVAPRGGRAARRARAMAQQSRMLSPGRTRGRDRSATATSDASAVAQMNNLPSPATTADDADIEPDFDNVSADGKDVDTRSSGVNTQSSALSKEPTTPPSEKMQLPQEGLLSSLVLPATPGDVPLAGRLNDRSGPEMGQFMPASAKSVHRAVLDGSTKAPSPFASRRGTQSRGLSRKRANRRDSVSTDQSTKKARRFSLDGIADLAASWRSETEVASEAPSSPGLGVRSLTDNSILPADGTVLQNDDVAEMDLDDVLNANMLWRNDKEDTETSSGSDHTEGNSPRDGTTPVSAASKRSRKDGSARSAGKSQVPKVSSTKRKRRLSTTTAKKSKAGHSAVTSSNGLSTSSESQQPGMNFNAVARWDRIPMRAFVDTQHGGGGHARSNSTGAQSDRQPRPLGAFLFTGSRGSNGAGAHNGFLRGRGGVRGSEHSPFRRSESAHDFSISMNVGVGATLLDRPKGGSGNGALIVSPVLFPVRNRSKSISTPKMESQSHKDATVATEGRVQMTRREKRERRARRQQRRIEAIDLQRAIEASAVDGRTWAQAAGHNASGKGKGKDATKTPASSNGKGKGKGKSHKGKEKAMDEHSPPSSGPYSPATALPRLSITDASPRASPGVQAPPRLPRREGSPSARAGDKMVAVELPQSPLAKGGSLSAGVANAELTDGADVAAGSILPPSSSYGGVPLHSPLFGGIAMYMAPSPTFGPRSSMSGSPNVMGALSSGESGSKEREKRETEELVELRI